MRSPLRLRPKSGAPAGKTSAAFPDAWLLGLGLAIVRHLVELHGGRVRAESAGTDKGATFVVEIPLARAPAAHGAPPLAPAHSRAPAAPAVRLDGVRVLVVDDEPDSLSAIAAVLRDAGADARSARSAAEALATFERWTPDLLVSDIGMPDENGYALIRKVRSLPPERGGRVPALALTAYTRPEDRTRALTSGFQRHVPKPVEPAELLQVAADLSRRAA